MTTIAYRDGVMAADSRAYSGSYGSAIGSKNKIHRTHDGGLLGVSTSHVGFPEAFLYWYDHGAELKDAPHRAELKYQALLVRPDGVYYAFGDFAWSGPLEAAYWVIGSSSDYAMGLMRMGAGAEEAVRLSCEYDRWSAPPITTMRLFDADHPDPSTAL